MALRFFKNISRHKPRRFKNLVLLMCLLATIDILLFFFSLQLDSFSISGINIDDATESTDSIYETFIDRMQKDMPNIPIVYWNKIKNGRYNETCAHLPNVYDIYFSSIYWQKLETAHVSFNLFNAYFDNRTVNNSGPSLRILAVTNKSNLKAKTHCQIWYDNKTQPVIKMSEYTHIRSFSSNRTKRDRKKMSYPYLITCPLPLEYKNEVPAAVSLVEKPCHNATNALRIIYKKPKKRRNFAVCYKGLMFFPNIIPGRLIEWFELLELLGVNKIFFYIIDINVTISKILSYYESKGLIHIVPFIVNNENPSYSASEPLFLTKSIWRHDQYEAIVYNDCFYRNMYHYRYIVPLDIDNVIMPTALTNWQELMINLDLKTNLKPEACYLVKNAYFLEDIVKSHTWVNSVSYYTYMLEHVYRSINFTAPDNYVKGFYNTELILTLNRDFPLSCLTGDCVCSEIDPTDAQIQHYGMKCRPKEVCNEYNVNITEDTKMWRFKNKLILKVKEVLDMLDITYKQPGQ